MRRHLEAVHRQTGIMPEALYPVLLPATLEYIWHYFFELNDARTSNGYTMNPISFTELDAWNRLAKKDITTQEISIIKQLDGVFLKHYQTKQADK